MKMMRMIIALICMIAATLARAEDGKLSAAYLVDPNGWTFQPVVAYKIASLDNILGTKHSLEIRSVAGYDTESQATNLGVAFVYPFQIAKNASLDFGFRTLIEGDRFRGSAFLSWTLYTK